MYICKVLVFCEFSVSCRWASNVLCCKKHLPAGFAHMLRQISDQHTLCSILPPLDKLEIDTHLYQPTNKNNSEAIYPSQKNVIAS